MILKIELGLATVALAYGLGCVLSHVMPDGGEEAIAFASGTLNDERRFLAPRAVQIAPI